jgi:replication factor C subunit 3/5
MEDEQRTIPWIEKYRPTQFDNIVLDPINRRLFENILTKNYFPNLLFYGPPGTGKTTTIINLINEYQTRYHRRNKSNVIHLNASDERGIDIIRNQINQFVKTMNLFESGLKFVILDEVDYMTKNAQQALKYLLQTSTSNVKYCLICNYISKIDESLQNEFISVRFNQLPKTDIHHFMKNIAAQERVDLSDDMIETIQSIYHSDIRSMINFIQLNQGLVTGEWDRRIMSNALLEELHRDLRSKPVVELIQKVHTIAVQYNIDKKNILLKYFDYVVRHYPHLITVSFLERMELCVHNQDIDAVIHYFCDAMK